MKILVVNGPNLNMLGIRERELYGDKDYSTLVKTVKEYAKSKGVKVKCVQSNEEGKLVTFIQKALGKFDGIIINAGAYSHTSIAILDALKSVNIPTVEVHLTNVNEREEFRKFSYISLFAKKCFCGEGFIGYLKAVDEIIKRRKEK